MASFHLLALSNRVSVWSWSCPPGRRMCWWGAADVGEAWNPSGHTWWPGHRTEKHKETAALLWSTFSLNTRRTQTKPYLHLVVAQGLQHFQADLLTFCWKQWQHVRKRHVIPASIWFLKLAQLSCAAISSCTQPGVQKQSSNTLRIAVLLILEDLTGYYLLLHLQ